jgi:hypothetical protein
MTWPLDKLGLINQMLALTGNDTVNVANDGSDNWRVGSEAYEHAIEFMYEDHDWKAITRILLVAPSPVAPEDEQFDTRYDKPPDCIHIVWVRINGLPVVYQIVGDHIELNATGVAPGLTIPSGVTPGPMTMKYVSSDPAGDASDNFQRMSRTFATALAHFVKAGIYSGLHEDVEQADKEELKGMKILQNAKTRADQEQPKRAAFNYRISAARRVRRPWPSVPTGWGGTGAPG